MNEDDPSENYVELAAHVVAAYVAKNTLAVKELGWLISDVHAALVRVTSGVTPPPPAVQAAVPIRKSVTPDYIVCLEDGKKFKSLKRHLRAKYDMSPEQYREKWGLSPDYPMVAPNYAEALSAEAMRRGLGSRAAGQRRSHAAKVRNVAHNPVRSSTPVKVGSELAAFGRRFGGIDLDTARDPSPARAVNYE